MIPKDLTPSQRSRLPKRHARVWAAVFAAEWARAFDDVASRAGFDHEDRIDHAERACTMADRAVYQLRTWERGGVG